jgi:hypothetical protein
MRYIEDNQTWGDDKSGFWGSKQDADSFIARVVSDEALKWNVDEHMRYMSAVISQNPLTSVVMTLTGSFHIDAETWVASSRFTSPAIKLNADALAEDLTDRLLAGHRAVLEQRKADLRATVDEYMES